METRFSASLRLGGARSFQYFCHVNRHGGVRLRGGDVHPKGNRGTIAQNIQNIRFS